MLNRLFLMIDKLSLGIQFVRGKVSQYRSGFSDTPGDNYPRNWVIREKFALTHKHPLLKSFNTLNRLFAMFNKLNRLSLYVRGNFSQYRVGSSGTPGINYPRLVRENLVVRENFSPTTKPSCNNDCNASNTPFDG